MSIPAGKGVLKLLTQLVVWPLSVLVTVSVLPHGARAVVHECVVGSGYRRKLARPRASVADGAGGMTMSTTAGSAPDGGPSRKIGEPGVDAEVDGAWVAPARGTPAGAPARGAASRRAACADGRCRGAGVIAVDDPQCRERCHREDRGEYKATAVVGVHCGVSRPWDVEKARDESLGTQGKRLQP